MSVFLCWCCVVLGGVCMLVLCLHVGVFVCWWCVCILCVLVVGVCWMVVCVGVCLWWFVCLWWWCVMCCVCASWGVLVVVFAC